MRDKLEKGMLKAIKAASDQQIKNTIDKKCIWWIYEPKVPKIIKSKQMKSNN